MKKKYYVKDKYNRFGINYYFLNISFDCDKIIMICGWIMKEILVDAIVDVLKLLPFLFLTFVLLEYLEHKMSKKNNIILVNNRKMGPIVGAILGAFPQCGFSCMATKLFSSRVITIGTLIAVYLSTSDEMIPIMISTGIRAGDIIKIIGIKIMIGITLGFIIDLICQKKNNIDYQKNIHDMCLHDDCHCEKGIMYSSFLHTLSILLYLFFSTLLINVLIYLIGEEQITNFLVTHQSLTYFISSLIGLIPNCASSVILTEIYTTNMISLGVLISGLLTGAGAGLLLLFKTNKNLKENIKIIAILYFVGVLVGYIIDLIGVII